MRSLPNMPTPWRVVVALVTAFLLISMGGQIAGAPLTVPALWWAARSSRSRAARAGFAVLAGMTMLFVGWFVTYLELGERRPFIIALPVAAFIGTIGVFASTTRPIRDTGLSSGILGNAHD